MSAEGLDDCVSGGLALIKKPHAADKDNGCVRLHQGRLRKGRSYARSPEKGGVAPRQKDKRGATLSAFWSGARLPSAG